jgi:hypothetical protein
MIIPDRFNPMARTLRSRAPARPGAANDAPAEAPLGGNRAEAIRRLQMGMLGVVAVLLLIGLASIIKDRATQTESTAVAEAVATTAPSAPTGGADPLAEAGVVPDIPDPAGEAAATDLMAQPSSPVPASPAAAPRQDAR